MLLVKESVLSFEEKTTQPLLNYLELLASTKHLLRLSRINIILDNFSI